LKSKVWIALVAIVVLLSTAILACQPAATDGAATVTKTVTATASGGTATVTTTATTTVTETAGEEPAKTIKWIVQPHNDGSAPFGPIQTDRYPYTEGPSGFRHWVHWLQDLSDGQLEIEEVPAGSIIPVAETHVAVRDGTLDACSQFPAYYTGQIPEGALQGGIPGGPGNSVEIYDLYMRWGLQDIFAEALDDYGVLSVSPLFWGGSVISVGGNFEMNTLEDIKGKKLRATGSFTNWAVALDAVPVNVAYADIYMAMKLGTIDGWVTGINGLEAMKLKEVTKYYLEKPNYGAATGTILVNKDSFAELPEFLQDAIMLSSSDIAMANDTTSQECAYIKVDSPTEFVSLSVEDQKEVGRRVKDEVWPELAAMCDRNAEIMDITLEWLKAYKKID
jgi:TRAP-type mannitol/chloroaromatic compound transport system substrate-binding protein